MAKFRTYSWRAFDDSGDNFAKGEVTAMSEQSAWAKSVADAFDALRPNTGFSMYSIEVNVAHEPAKWQG